MSAREGGPRLSVRERNKLRTRRELLDAALEVFAEVGYGSASVEKIAERAGVAKATGHVAIFAPGLRPHSPAHHVRDGNRSVRPALSGFGILMPDPRSCR